MDYIGKKNFPSVTSREFFLEFFGDEKEYKKEMIKWLRDKEENIDKIQEVVLEK